MSARIITSETDIGGITTWLACEDRLTAHDAPIGNGATEAAAIADLNDMLEQMEAAK